VKNLQGKRIAILATNGFEQAELLEPQKALSGAGAKTDVISPQSGKIKAWDKKDWGADVAVDVELNKAKADEYDALVLPGGVINPDALRIDADAVRFVRHFVEAGKPIAAICHGPWTLIEAGGVKGRRMTSWASLRTDLTNAGAKWVDQEVVADHGLITSRRPDDIPAFVEKVAEEIATAKHTAASTASR
jgi:protease I